MLTWGHYWFRQHLLNKAREYPWEEYTSKTQGVHRHDMGGRKTVTCPQCHVTMNRDGRGARNIYLKNEDLVVSATRLISGWHFFYDLHLS